MKIHGIVVCLLCITAVSGGNVCFGTQNAISHEGGYNSSFLRLERMRRWYTNCTIVDGNLEIVFLNEEENYDLTFLSSIQEVTGYVLILGTYADYVPLTNLRIIRGRNLYEAGGNNFALYVALNFNPDIPNVGLKELRFRSLTEITKGDVGIFNNKLLCHHLDVNWYDIMMGHDARFHAANDIEDITLQCGECHPSCAVNIDNHDYYKNNETKNCWGEGPDMCQTLTRAICSRQCDWRCSGRLPNQCCHPECAAGCTGPTRYDCLACAKFNNSGACVPFCPGALIYDETQYMLIPNPDVRYAYGTVCVEECPPHLIQEENSCVKECSQNKQNKDGACVPCDGPCPKPCDGLHGEDFINANNIDQFAGCTHVGGNIVIASNTFLGDAHMRVPPMHPSRLYALQDIREISGYLMIQGDHGNFTDLRFLSNLKIINGRNVDIYGASLHVYATSITSLELQSLEEVQNGLILIASNAHLCYAESIDWAKIRAQDDQRLTIMRNRPHEECVKDGFLCHPECSADGCWGSVPENCFSCKNFKVNRTCVSYCDPDQQMYLSDLGECELCHPECRDNCTGPGPGNCSSCKHVKDGPYCKEKCPGHKYADEHGSCLPCHSKYAVGCPEPKNTTGSNTITNCAVAEVTEDASEIIRCLPSNTATCAPGFYFTQVPSNSATVMAGKPVCQRCHYVWEGSCVPNCSIAFNLYPDEENKTCRQCHKQCYGCTGPTPYDCKKCLLYKEYQELNNIYDSTVFRCTSQCAMRHEPVEVTLNDTREWVCKPMHSSAVRCPVSLILTYLIPQLILLWLGSSL